MTDQSRREFLQDLATVPALAGLGGAALSVDSNLFAGDGRSRWHPRLPTSTSGRPRR
ncbi:twin-arginine translocation signal domain-containing protein [Halosimplex aquaticum]